MKASKMDTINNFVKAYRSFAQIPTIIQAEILDINLQSHLVKITSKWSQRNIEKGEITKFQKHHVLQLSSKKVVFESLPIDITQEAITKMSRTGKYQGVVRETREEGKKKMFLEIWDQQRLFKNFDISAFNIHGDIYSDGEFGSLEWSPGENKLLYIAEKKGRSVEPFYKQGSLLDKEQKKQEDEPAQGDEYLYRPDWGEQLVDKHQPVIGVCDVAAETLSVLSGIPDNFSPGQVFWSPDGNSIFGVVYENEPRRLGLIYCTNRTGYIFNLNFKGEFKILSDKNKSVRSPRLSPDGKFLYWLQRSIGGAHNGCHELIRLKLGTKEVDVLIGVVQEGDQVFSGLYMHDLPSRCFSKDGLKLLFSTLNRFRVNSYYIDLESKKIHQMKTQESATILDVYEDMVLISTGSLQQTPALKMSASIAEIEWISITESEILCKDSIVEEMDFESSHYGDEFSYYNAIYYGPPAEGASTHSVPLLVYPHGGPHSAIYNDYSLEFNFFVTLGYGIAAVNYRGSTGVGQKGIDFLRGKLGDSDVKDIHEAVLKILETYPCLDKKNVFLYGKSYGGFLVAQLSAQHPDFYRAVVNCNGVSDVSSMYITSDIPDWSTAECGLNFDESHPLSLEDIKKMVEVSPIYIAKKIKAPSLFMVGKKDLRVPYYQGLSLYNALKAGRTKTRLNLYDSNHTLGSVPVHMDYFINSALWFWKNKV